MSGGDGRLGVPKTYKMYVGGAFVRSESGRTYPARSAGGDLLAHAVAGSRKDVRDAVRAARGAQAAWAARTAYNRGQILYRVAEVMDSRRAELVGELARAAAGGQSAADPAAEVDAATDRWIWYAGWCDKYPQVLGGANPVAGPYFNFTVPEPMGVVGLAAPDEAPLLGIVSRLAPALVPGNAAVVLAGERCPLAAVTLGEILATSDVPAGVVNILTGRRAPLVRALAGVGDVDCVDLTGCDPPDADPPDADPPGVDPAGADPPGVDLVTEAERLAAATVTRVVRAAAGERRWLAPSAQSPHAISAFCEYKTVWHPKGR
ncbi:MAG: aldehyde dehydrogenase family protein [Acidimicrobiia bacterium]|nr:aldehyde dehydrogenase family protein [Acidimicrobiia bacterium]MYB25500.1 aldehyde dehydrogenase family protein [Acidimicrobiia bacterium]MYJ13355.1 aldehyde dehydrogenase family protein [Acidimicrobiia bacterium]